MTLGQVTVLDQRGEHVGVESEVTLDWLLQPLGLDWVGGEPLVRLLGGGGCLAVARCGCVGLALGALLRRRLERLRAFALALEAIADDAAAVATELASATARWAILGVGGGCARGAGRDPKPK